MKKYILSILLPLFLFLGTAAFAVTRIQVPQGGTGAGTFTAGYILMGNDTGAITAISTSTWNTAYGWGDHSIQNYFDTDIHTLDNIPDGATYKLLTAIKDGYINQDVTNGASPTFTTPTINGLVWDNVTLATSSDILNLWDLDDLGNVDTSGLATGDTLHYDGSNWISSSTLFVNATTGTVSIGTTTSCQKLCVDGSIRTTDTFYGNTWTSYDGDSMNIKPSGDEDDFLSFKTVANRATIKVEGDSKIYVQSSDSDEVGIEYYKDASHSGGVIYYKNEELFGLTSQDPMVFKVCGDYDDYVKICSADNIPELSVASSSGFKINAGGTNSLLLNHAGGNVGIGTDSPSDKFSIVNANATNAHSIDQNGNVGTNIVTDGALHIENTGNTGIGLGVYSNLGATADAPLVKIQNTNAAFDQDAVYINSNTSQSVLHLVTGLNGYILNADKAVVNSNSSGISGRFISNSIVTDGSTYTNSTSVLFLQSEATEISGTITDSAIVLDINQTHADAMGNVVDIANAGTGNSLVVDTSAFVIDSSGNVGIGTTTPLSKFSMNSGANGFRIDSSGIVQQGTWQGTALTDAYVSNTLTVDGYLSNTGDIGTGVYDFGGADSFELPNNTNLTIDANGEVYVNTTSASSSLRYYDGTAERALYPISEKTITIASSTLNSYKGQTASSTIPLGVASIHGETWTELSCYTDAGTVEVEFGDGTNWIDYQTLSTSLTTDSSLSNNTFTRYEKRYIRIGQASSLGTLSCVVSIRKNAD